MVDFVFVFFQLIAKGKSASELFPAVVKNVASKNIEVWHHCEIIQSVIAAILILT